MIQRTKVSLLMEQAKKRLEKSVVMRRCKERLGEAIDEIDECLADAEACVLDLLKIEQVCNEVSFIWKDGYIHLGEDVVFPAQALQFDVREAQKCYTYGFTLGYDSQEALHYLKQDYIVHQFQHLISKEVLFMLGRDIFKQFVTREPGYVMKRSAILLKSTEEDDNPCLIDDEEHRSYWSPTYVSDLLGLMPELKQIQVMESGCLSPVYSVMGLMFAYQKKGGTDV